MIDYRITKVSVTESDVIITLANGQRLDEPIRRHIRLEKATPAEREGWVLTADSQGLNWPVLWAPSPNAMVDVWTILKDRIYDVALHRSRENHHKLVALSARDRNLVALWRLESDVNNGGFLQFFCNWGEETLRIALAALDAIGALETARLVREMHAVIDPFESLVKKTLEELYGLLLAEDNEALGRLDEAFWNYPDNLPRLVVKHYGEEPA